MVIGVDRPSGIDQNRCMNKMIPFLTSALLFLSGVHTENLPASDKGVHKLGIDISVHSGAIDWNGFDPNRFAFVFLKASEGVDLMDTAFHGHWAELQKRRIPRGAYHFYVTEDDPREQAEFFIKTVGDDCGDMPPVLDIELLGHNSPKAIESGIRIWLERVEKHYGVRPIIYTSPNFWDRHVQADFSGYPLWVAEYGVFEPRLPNGWSNWTMWQFKENQPLHWVEKGADISRISLADIKKILSN